ncbi:MAG: excisionase family DNA-binding protein [Acidimicrobiales bacterium]
MTEPAVVEIRAKATERKTLRALRSLVHDPGAEVTVTVGGEVVVLPRSLVELLRVAAGALEDGESLAVVSDEAEVTPAEAAKLLSVSRQYVDRLIASGALPVRRLPGSSYRKIPARAVLAHRATRERKRAGIRAVVEDAVAAGLEY